MIKTALIIEDCKTTAKWFKASLEKAYKNIDITLFADYQTARNYLPHAKVDLALIDINLPDGNGLDLISPLLTVCPASYIVVISVLDDNQHILKAIQNGAKGYLLKGLSEKTFIHKIRAISDGSPPLSPSIAQKILQLMRHPIADIKPENRQTIPPDDLTKREKEVLGIIAKGYNRKETSQALEVSESTIATHVRHIYAKLSISSRSEATLAACQMGLINVNLV